jgi:radical SAM superfamily enzyme YgiQ (UPF0313 family)
MMCDLTHSNKVLASDNVPLGIGMLAAYSQKCLGAKYEFGLYKEPHSLDEDFEAFSPHILALSNYVWNERISLQFARHVKKSHPNIVTVFGGPNYPLDFAEREKFLKAHPEIDFYLPHDAEISFTNCLKLLRENNYNPELIKTVESIDGCDYIYQGKLVSGENLPRLPVTEIPSPYLLGMFDKFLNPKWEPLIITARGCPFQCTFCVEGQDYYTKVHFRDTEEVKAELIYIANALQGTEARLLFADSNFGMYNANIKVAKIVEECRESHGWPSYVTITGGKNKKERVLEAVKYLGKRTSMAFDIQSSDPNILDAIGRKNVSLDTLVETTQELDNMDMGSYSGIILALPLDSTERFLQSVKDLMTAKIQKIVVFTLMVLHGSKLGSIEHKKKFDYLMSYRAFPRSCGKYRWGDTKYAITEVDKVAIGNPTLNKEDYLFCRAFSLTVALFYNDKILEALHNFLKTQGVGTFDFIYHLHSRLEQAPLDLSEFYKELKTDIESELFSSEELLLKHFQENVGDYLNETVGNNLYHKTMTQGWLDHLDSILKFAFEEATYLLNQKNGEMLPQMAEFLGEMQTFIYLRCTKFMDPDRELKHEFRHSPDQLRTGKFFDNKQQNLKAYKVVFRHNDGQKAFINARLLEVSNSNSGMGRVLSSQTNVTALFRDAGH